LETKNQQNRILDVWVNLCRFLLGIVFVFSGFVKAIDPLGSTYKIQDYAEAFGLTSFIPGFLPLFLAIFLAVFELSVGGYLLFGIRKNTSTALALLMLIFMTPLTFYLALKNPVSDCGCFGDALVLTNWQTFYKNIIFAYSCNFAALSGKALGL